MDTLFENIIKKIKNKYKIYSNYNERFLIFIIKEISLNHLHYL